MEESLDTRTLFVISTLIYYFLAFIIYLNWTTFRNNFKGIGLWSIGMGLFATGFLLIAMRGIVHDMFSIVIANTIIVLGASLFFRGTRLFYGSKSSEIINYVLTGLIFVTFLYFTFTDPKLHTRIMLVFSAYAIVMIRTASLHLNAQTLYKRYIAFTVTFIYICAGTLLIFALGLALGVHMPHGNEFFAIESPQVIPLLICLLSILGVAVGSLQVASNRLLESETRLVEERTMLIKETHHRVKNNLAVINSLLFMQARASGDAKLSEALQASINRISSMSLLYEMLNTKDQIGVIRCSEYVPRLINHISQSFMLPDVKIHSDIDSCELSIDDMISCSLIINELVTNAFKYAFADKQEGEILLKMTKETESYIFIVRDNGVGLPDDFSTEDRPGSMGMRIVNALVGQLKGEMQVNSHGGAEFRITFKGTDTAQHE